MHDKLHRPLLLSSHDKKAYLASELTSSSLSRLVDIQKKMGLALHSSKDSCDVVMHHQRCRPMTGAPMMAASGSASSFKVLQARSMAKKEQHHMSLLGAMATVVRPTHAWTARVLMSSSNLEVAQDWHMKP